MNQTQVQPLPALADQATPEDVPFARKWTRMLSLIEEALVASEAALESGRNLLDARQATKSGEVVLAARAVTAAYFRQEDLREPMLELANALRSLDGKNRFRGVLLAQLDAEMTPISIGLDRQVEEPEDEGDLDAFDIAGMVPGWAS